jgi:hypothetical protein
MPARGAQWGEGATPWIIDCLTVLNAIDHPEFLVGMSVETLEERLQLGSTRLIVLLLFIECAWERRIGMEAVSARAVEPPDAVIAPVEWPIEELQARARELVGRSGGNLPTINDLRFSSRLAAVCKVGQSVRDALVDVAEGKSRADSSDQAALVDGLSRAIDGTARDEIAEIGEWAVVRRFDELQRARNLEMYRGRFGLDGHDGSTLQSVGQRYGLTRERVRQIVDKMLKAIADQPIWTPACDRCYAHYLSLLPAPKAVLVENETLRRLLGDHLSIEELERFAQVFLKRRATSSKASRNSVVGKRVRNVMVASKAQAKIAAAVHRWAVRIVGHVGAAQAEWVAAKATKETMKVVTEDHVKAMLHDAPDFEWLHEPTGWFWFRDLPRNRLANRLERMLCVGAERMPMEMVYAGLVRADRDKRWSVGKLQSTASTVLPPTLVVAEICRRLPFARVCGQGRVSASIECRPPEKVLGRVDMAILEAMRARGGVIRRGEARACVLASVDVTKITFEVLFGDAPFVSCIGRDLYALRGLPIDGERLAQATASIASDLAKQGAESASRLDVKRGDGRLSWTVTLTDAMARNYLVPVPARASDGLTEGSCVVSGIATGSVDVLPMRRARGSGWRLRGMAPLLIPRIPVGGRVRLDLNIAAREVSVALVHGAG